MHVAHRQTIENGLHCPRRKEILRESALTYQMQFIKSPQQLQHHREDRQGNNMHGRMMFGKHTQVYVYDVL